MLSKLKSALIFIKKRFFRSLFVFTLLMLIMSEYLLIDWGRDYGLFPDGLPEPFDIDYYRFDANGTTLYNDMGSRLENTSSMYAYTVIEDSIFVLSHDESSVNKYYSETRISPRTGKEYHSYNYTVTSINNPVLTGADWITTENPTGAGSLGELFQILSEIILIFYFVIGMPLLLINYVRLMWNLNKPEKWDRY